MTRKCAEKYLIIGAGHGGKAMAAYLASMDKKVNLWNRTHKHIRYIESNRKLFLEYHPDIEEDLYFEESVVPKLKEVKDKDGFKRGYVKLNRVSSKMEEAFKDDPDVIMVVIPARGHKYVARKIAPYLEDKHTVLLNPGRMFGALEFRNEVKKFYDGKNEKMPKVTIGEAETLVYACRSEEHQQDIKIHGVKGIVNFATIPSKKAMKISNLIEDVYPQFNCESDNGNLMNVLHTSLGNVGGVLHVPTTLANAILISEEKKIKFYVEGTRPPATITLIKAVDRERVRVARKMGIKVDSLRKWLENVWNATGISLGGAIKHVKAYRDIIGPDDLNTRYLWEDVPCSLVPLASLGKQMEENCRATDACITFADIYLNEPTRFEEPSGESILKYGRTMESLGLDKLNKEQIKEYLETGKHPLGL